MGKKVFVALSGGVDSSVAAALLKERGFDVVGIHMKMWDPADSYQLPATSYRRDPVCRQQYQDRIDAVRVAAALDIPFQTWDFSGEYHKAVVEYMIRGYANGGTPNPDVMCNRHIKFGLFLERALEAGADFIATGHYVRESQITNHRSQTNSKSQSSNLEFGAWSLGIARDEQKDQSYFLWTLTQEQLRHCVFLIGDYTKPEVRAMARRFRLPTAEKHDSQGICFIGEINMRTFLRSYIPERSGRVFTTAGRNVGEHGGAAFYTIGQRQGIGIGGGVPYYVVAKDTAANTLTVAEGPRDPALFRNALTAEHQNWISGEAPKFPLRCEARIRYRQPLQACTITEIRNSRFEIRASFEEPQRAMTPGQSIVFYEGKTMLGGAVIAEAA